MNRAPNINLAAGLEELRDAVDTASKREFVHSILGRLPGIDDWLRIKSLARSALATEPSILDGMSPEARKAAERVLEAALDLARLEGVPIPSGGSAGWQQIANTRTALYRAGRDFAMEALCCNDKSGSRPSCTFRRNHPGVCSWDVQVEPAKRTKKGARR